MRRVILDLGMNNNVNKTWTSNRYIKLHNHNILNKNDMLIMIDLLFVLLIWVLTDAKRPWVGLRCILNASYLTRTILTAS